MKKYQTYLITVIAIGTMLAAGAGVSAQLYPFDLTPTTTDQATPTVPLTPVTPTVPSGSVILPMPIIIEVDMNGNVLLRGIAQSVGTSTVAGTSMDSMTVSSWGGTWTIRTGTTTEMLPVGMTDLSGIEVGDLIGVIGTVASDQPFTVDATLVRNWTASNMAL